MRPVSKVSLKGVAETILKVEQIGDWDIIGEVYVYTGGNINLISVPTLDKMGMDSKFGDEKCVVTKRSDGEIVLTGYMDDTGLYRIELEVEECTISSNPLEMKGITEQVIDGADYMTTEAVERARGAYRLHSTTGHLDDTALGEGLDNGCYTNCIYTSRDLKNARKQFGACISCLEAKQKEPDEPTSQGMLPPYPGHTLVGDLKSFKYPTIGGNKWALIMQCRLTGMGKEKCMKFKNEKDLWKSLLHIINYFNGSGRRVVFCLFDNEAVFVCIQRYLHAIASLMIWLKVMYFLRVFRPFGHLIQAIVEVL